MKLAIFKSLLQKPFVCKSFLSALIIYSSTLMAKDSSEYFYHLESAQNSLSLSYTSLTMDLDLKNNDNATKAKLETESQKFSLSYMYGVTSELNFALNISQSDTETTVLNSKTSSDGIEDIVLGLQYKDLLSAGVLFYQANLHISLEDSETNSQSESNEFSGGHSLDLGIGYQFDYGIYSFGIAVEKEFLLEDKTQVVAGNSTNNKVSGGEVTSISVFSEINHSDMLSSSYVFTYAMAEDTKTDNGSSTSTTDDINEFYSLTLALVAKQIGPGDLLAGFAYVVLKDDQTSDYTVTEDQSLAYTLGYRINF